MLQTIDLRWWELQFGRHGYQRVAGPLGKNIVQLVHPVRDLHGPQWMHNHLGDTVALD